LKSAIADNNISGVYSGTVKKNFNADEKIQASLNNAAKSLKTANMDETHYQKALMSLAEFYCMGYNEFWNNLWNDNMNLVNIPTYPFKRKKYWPNKVSKEIKEKNLNNNTENNIGSIPEVVSKTKNLQSVSDEKVILNKTTQIKSDVEKAENNSQHLISLTDTKNIADNITKTNAGKTELISLKSPKAISSRTFEKVEEKYQSETKIRLKEDDKKLQMLYPKKKTVVVKNVAISPLTMLKPKSYGNKNSAADEIDVMRKDTANSRDMKALDLLYPKKKELNSSKYSIQKSLKLLYPKK
jgi:acyl transferase domain-containing protein